MNPHSAHSDYPKSPRHAQINRPMVEGPTEEPEDIFDSSLNSLFSIPPIAFSASSSSAFVTYSPPPASQLGPISLRLPQPDRGVWMKLQANHLWLSAVYLTDQLSTGQIGWPERPSHLQEKQVRVAELGAGAGLPGIIACLRGAEVISTDWGDPDILSSLRDNFARTCGPDRAWTVAPHEWGSDPAPLLATRERKSRRFDLLLMADTLWVTDAHSALLDSIFALLSTEGIAHVAAGLHTGRGPVERFCRAARERGAVVETVRELRYQGEGQWEGVEPVDDGTGSREEVCGTEERGVVVHMTLKLP